ncbi:GNAT family N-acetyltransferase [Aeromonas simiae]|uniref:GNAT family N-acetyltransferase n=2 Tax=Aeromonas simiae TaxID=218936 RepID=A0A5J6WT29_9GAMM|nr:GNAT family N-acetyltransferase [Aeromonas simiae]
MFITCKLRRIKEGVYDGHSAITSPPATMYQLLPAHPSHHVSHAFPFRRDAWRISFGQLDTFDEQDTLAWLARLHELGRLYHLWHQDEIIGQLELSPALVRPDGVQEGYLYLLYLCEPWRGRGAGLWLHDQALARIRAAGSHRAGLRVGSGNTRAANFYRRLGWQPVGTPDARGQLMHHDLFPRPNQEPL